MHIFNLEKELLEEKKATEKKLNKSLKLWQP
jgi:hypothetical protein